MASTKKQPAATSTLDAYKERVNTAARFTEAEAAAFTDSDKFVVLAELADRATAIDRPFDVIIYSLEASAA